MSSKLNFKNGWNSKFLILGRVDPKYLKISKIH